MLNVLKFDCRPAYYVRHPLKFLRELRNNMRNAIMRVRYGWCHYDIWNMDNWMLTVLPEMLRYLAENGCGYPGTDEFPTSEAWENWLKYIAASLESCKEDEVEKRNPYNKGYHHELEVHFNEMDEELRENYWTEQKRLWEERNELLKQVGTDLFAHLDNLWD